MSKKTEFVHIHVHSDYSLLDGCAKINDLVSRAKEMGQKALATTEHGNTSSHYHLQKECDKQGIHSILGTEFYISDGENKSGHLIAIAKDNIGLKNMYKLQEKAYKEGFYYKPRISFDWLKEYGEGLIITSACIANPINRLILNGDIVNAKAEVLRYKQLLGSNFYLELQSIAIPEQYTINNKLIEISDEMGIELIITNDVHYTLKSDYEAHDVMLALQIKKKVNDEKRFRFPCNSFWLKSEEEIREGVSYIPSDVLDKAILNTSIIASKCKARIETGNYLPKYYNIPKGKTTREVLVKHIKKGIINKNKKNDVNYLKEIQNEIDVIDRNGYSDYFLIVEDYIKSARKNGILVGEGRGSCAGSKVSYVLDITRIDPAKHHLLFERFLADGREPDIDTDFSDQDAVFYDLQDKYGENSVAKIITFGKMTPKAVTRKILSAYGYSQQEIKRVNSHIKEDCKKIEDAIHASKELQEYVKNHQKEFDIIKRLEGCISHVGQHAGGVVVWKDLSSTLPITLKASERDKPIVGFDKYMLEELGYFKFDVLGLETLPILNRCLKNIKNIHNITIDLNKLDYDDENVYQDLCKGDVSGVFQLSNQASKVMEQQPKNFDDLIAINALIRPGVGDWNEYIARRRGRTYTIHELREPYMRDTCGILTYQEQFMLDAKIFAGWDLAFADKRLRKNKHIEEDEELKEKYIFDVMNNGHKRELAESLWQETEKSVSGGYSFNKSHSACYARVTFQTAYLKHYYPIEFYASLMTSNGDDQEEISKLISECKEKDIKILPPNINTSTEEFIPTKGGIMYRITTITHVGKTAIKEINKLRPIESFEDLHKRRTKSKLKNNSLIMLIKAGAMDDFGKREELLWKIDMSNRTKTQIKNNYECEKYPSDVETYLAWEKESLGMYLSAHPMDKYNFPPFSKYQNESFSIIGGEVLSTNEALQKNGKTMCFTNVDTKHGIVRVLIFANNWKSKKTKENIKEGNITLIRGRKSGDSLLYDSSEVLEKAEEE